MEYLNLSFNCDLSSLLNHRISYSFAQEGGKIFSSIPLLLLLRRPLTRHARSRPQISSTTILPDNSWADFFYALSSFTSHPHLVHPYPLAPRRFHKMHADPVTVERGKNRRIVERCVNLGKKSWFERRFFTCRFGIEVWNEGIREELCNY